MASFLKLSMIFLPARRGAPADAAGVAGSVPGLRIGGTMKASMLILASLCVATGLFADATTAAVSRLLGAPPPASGAFTAANLLKALQTLALGAAVFGLAMSKPGKRLAAAIRGRPRSFAGLVMAFLGGLAVLAAALARFG